MKLSEFIQQAQQMAAQTDIPDPALVLYDRLGDRTMKLDADADVWDFELTRGQNEIVIEFD